MDLLALGRAVLENQPFSVLVGAQLDVFKEGIAELRIPVTDRLKQQHGFLHGGVISYAADNALTFVGGSVLGPAVVTSEYKINYLRPVKEGCLIARAEVIYTGKNLAVCRCDIFEAAGEGERLCATAQGTISRLGKNDGA